MTVTHLIRKGSINIGFRSSSIFLLNQKSTLKATFFDTFWDSNTTWRNLETQKPPTYNKSPVVTFYSNVFYPTTINQNLPLQTVGELLTNHTQRSIHWEKVKSYLTVLAMKSLGLWIQVRNAFLSYPFKYSKNFIFSASFLRNNILKHNLANKVKCKTELLSSLEP